MFKISKFVSIIIMVASGIVFTGASATLHAAQPYNDAQLRLLFNGSSVVADGHYCIVTAEELWKIKFETDGTFTVQRECNGLYDGAYKGVDDSGRWMASNGLLCFEYNKFPADDDCWSIAPSRFWFLATLSSGGRSWNLNFNHPKYSSRDTLMAALKEVKNSPVVVAAPTPSNAVSGIASQRAEAAVREADLLKIELARFRAEVKTQAAMVGLQRKRLEQEQAMAEIQRMRAALEASSNAAPAPAEEANMELALWQEVKNSGDEAALQRFLGQYPDGRFSGEARSRVEQLGSERQQREETRAWALIQSKPSLERVRDYLVKFPGSKHAGEATAKAAVFERFKLVEGVDFGNYHALVIAIDKYKHLQNLGTAIKDGNAVAEVLKRDYGFKVTLMENPNRDDIVDVLDDLRETLTEKDNLVIYYAGHGWQDESSGQGYWLASDAKSNRRSRWLSNATLVDTLKTLHAKHVMVVADSCFSGTLVRAAKIGFNDADYKSGEYWRRMVNKQTRVAIVSGGLEPVADDGGSGHSPFAKAFIDALQENQTVIDGSALFSKLRRPVIVAAQQTPQYSDVRNTGHDGGDFLFVRKAP